MLQMEVEGKFLLEQPRSLKKSQDISKYLEKSRNRRKHAKMCIEMLICTHDKGRHTADSALKFKLGGILRVCCCQL